MCYTSRWDYATIGTIGIEGPRRGQTHDAGDTQPNTTEDQSMHPWFRLLIVVIAVAGTLGPVRPIRLAAQDPSPSRLAVIWSSADPDVAKRVCFMYTHAAQKQKWFDEVTLIVWGPSARLLVGDKDLQAEVKAMAADGVKVVACLACADSYGVTPQLRALGLEVKYMGRPLTDMLKGGWKVLTF